MDIRTQPTKCPGEPKKLIVVVFFVIILAALSVVWCIKKPHISRSYKSPITTHVIEVWVYGELFSVPGDAGSGAGFVVLKDANGKILERKPTDLVISIDPPRWFIDRVEVPLFVQWKLGQ
jgi:hypothetical protein